MRSTEVISNDSKGRTFLTSLYNHESFATQDEPEKLRRLVYDNGNSLQTVAGKLQCASNLNRILIYRL